MRVALANASVSTVNEKLRPLIFCDLPASFDSLRLRAVGGRDSAVAFPSDCPIVPVGNNVLAAAFRRFHMTSIARVACDC